MNSIILIALIIFLNHGCGEKDENCHKIITFKNLTTSTLYVVSSYQYPDTSTFAGIPNPTLNPNFTKVFPGQINTQALWNRDCIESVFKSLIPCDTMMIYVFDAKVLEGNEWETVKTNYLVLKRYDLSLDDLNKKNWTINFP